MAGDRPNILFVMSDDHASGIRIHDSITSRNPGMANWKARGQKLR